MSPWIMALALCIHKYAGYSKYPLWHTPAEPNAANDAVTCDLQLAATATATAAAAPAATQT